MKQLLTTFTTLIALGACSAADALPGGLPIDRTPKPDAVRVQEAQSLKWGMWVNWSFSTFSGHEWTPGVKDLSMFKPTGCDTDQWCKVAKEAGMGYILFLTKHHDGFCLWDTKTTDRKVTNHPFKRDVLAELRKSCDKFGLKLALYFSQGEFRDNKDYHPGGYTPEMKKAQLTELLTQYGPIEFLWLDAAQKDGGLSHEETATLCKALQPNCFVGFNHGPRASQEDLRIGERGRPAPLTDSSGAGHGSQDASKFAGFLVAEFCYPILPLHKGGADWFYSLPVHDNFCHPARKLYLDYLESVKYGNFFDLAVNPGYDGRLRAIDVETLQQVGRWIRGEESGPKNLALHKPVEVSSTFSSQAQHSKSNINDGDRYTGWSADLKAREAWVTVDLQAEREVSQVMLCDSPYIRTQEFDLEAKIGDEWKQIASGTTIRRELWIDFPPVKARLFRLNLRKTSNTPFLAEFQIIGHE